MRKIYKYPLKIEDVQRIEIPRESKILNFIGTVQMNNSLVWHIFEEI